MNKHANFLTSLINNIAKLALIFIFILQSSNITAQNNNIQINGRVFDEEGKPLIGAVVTIQGTTKATATDANGNYFITVPNEKTVLNFEYIGYKKDEVVVGKQININVVLQGESITLDEAVVVGYGHMKRASVVGSITTIEPKQLQIGTTRSISNNLAGQLAGVIAVQRSGETGWDNSEFWIRGVSSFASGTSPLVLVDGIERSLNNIDPAEIESLSVLKDASASAMYGVRGANGVILINTKRGQVGKPQVTARVEHGFTSPVNMPEFIGSTEYLELLNEISREGGALEEELRYSAEYIDNFRNNVDPDLYPNTNWLDEIFNKGGHNTRANVTVSGGNDFLRYSVVSSVYSELGLVKRDPNQEWDSSPRLQRYSARNNVDINVTPTTQLRVNIGGYLQQRQRTTNSIDALFSDAFSTTPFAHPAIYSSGEIPRQPLQSNPWSYATQTGYGRYNAAKLETLFALEQDLEFITKGLKTKATFSFDYYTENSVSRTKDPDYYLPATDRLDDGTLDLTIQSYGQQFLGYSTGSEWGSNSTYFEYNLTYTKKIADHTIDVLALYNHRQYDNGDKLPYRNQGISGRLSYNYANRYIAEFNFGYNGSENFAKGQRFGFFPSIAAGWLISEEPFMQNVKGTISKLKLRGSYGLVGNDNLGGRRFAYITTIASDGSYRWGVNNDYYRAGRREGDQGVADLTWETVAKANLGFELGVANKFNLQVDVFRDLRSNIFMQRQTIPGSSGFTSYPWANYGKVENQGVDLSVDYSDTIGEDFNFTVRGTFTYAHNEVLEKDEPLNVIGTNRSETGHSVGQLFGLVDQGLFTEEDFNSDGTLVEGIPDHNFGPVRPGDIRYEDANGDGVVDALDYSPIGGTVNPEIVYGFGLSMNYKGFDLSVFFQGSGKTDRIIGGADFIPGSNSGSKGNIYTNYLDRWTPSNPSQDVFWPRLTMGRSENNLQSSTWWLKDMSILRVKNIELGYTLPESFVGKVGLKGLRVYVAASNPIYFSDFDLWDPELGVGNGMRYPIMKSYSFGLNLNF